VAVNFMQNQSQAIIKSTNGYKLSIIRFALNTETLPIFIPTMQSKNGTIYSITMELNGLSTQLFMQFEPQNLNPGDPDEYYYVYNYQFLIYLVNKCFASCFDNLDKLTMLPTDLQPPIMTYDSNTQKCTISFDNEYFGYNESNKINIYKNYAMYTLFASLPNCIVNRNVLGMDLQLNNLISPDPSKLTQDYSTIGIWNPVSSVIFTSNLLPIFASQTPPLQIYANGALLNGSSTFNFLNILTDFIGNDLNFVPYIQYAPAIYRFLSLKQNAEIRNIDLQVYWRNKSTGELKPLYIGVGGSASVKILLTKDF
jgi:hypothetical protein